MNTNKPNQVEIIDVIDSEATKSMKTYSMIVYGLYTLGLFLGGLPTLIGAITTWLYIGFVILFAVGIWYVYRLVRGFVRMHDGQGAW